MHGKFWYCVCCKTAYRSNVEQKRFHRPQRRGCGAEKVPSALLGNPMVSSPPPCHSSGKIQGTNDQQTTRVLSAFLLVLTVFIYYAQARHTVSEHGNQGHHSNATRRAGRYAQRLTLYREQQRRRDFVSITSTLSGTTYIYV